MTNCFVQFTYNCSATGVFGASTLGYRLHCTIAILARVVSTRVFRRSMPLPVIWATQVLETLAKNGIPSPSEITDAAMGERAECVMLNKGPYIVTAVRVLGDILRRMQPHHEKKNSMLRKLQLAVAFHAGARSF
jgi:hypothetical protein